jgi:acetate kinase
MKILVANLGSTSLKYRLFACAGGEECVLARGSFERVTDYGSAIERCLTELVDEQVLRDEKELAAVGFKTVVARGVTGCVRVDDKVLAALEAYRGIAPAHNPPYVDGIREFARRMPGTPLVALFETAFYQWVLEAASRYAIPESWHELGVRRWSFHGASHKFVAERSAELLGRPDVAERVRRLYIDGPGAPPQDPKLPIPPKPPELRVISCHLGGSSSVTGIRNGVAIGSSMGFSPQSGLPQNDRVGDLDAAALPYVMRATGISLDEAERALTKESGLKALSGGHNDLRDIKAEQAKGNPRAQLALDVLIHETRRWVGSFHFEMDGIDALVFTAGMGENEPLIRAGVCAHLQRLGIHLDEEANRRTVGGLEGTISAADAPAKVLVIPANEELVVAREVRRLLEASPAN